MSLMAGWRRQSFHSLSGGGLLAFRESGSGQPLLLLHGFTGSSLSWPPWVIETLGRSFHLVAPDLPGHGSSPVPPLDGSPAGSPKEGGNGVEWIASELLALMEWAGLERFSVAGYSMGGRIALTLAILAPERVTAMVLESASPGLRTAEEREHRKDSDEGLAVGVETKGMVWFTDRWMGLPLFRTRLALPEEARRDLRTRMLENDPTGLAFALRHLGTGTQISHWGQLKEVRVPALLLAGGLDEKFVRINREMARGIGGSQLVIIPGVGHTMHLEAPDLWTDLVSMHLAKHVDGVGEDEIRRSTG